MARLEEQVVRERLAGLDGWGREGDAIVRTFRFDTFPDAIAFVGRVADAAEAADHHPDIDIRYTRVSLRLSTHDAGGLTTKDFEMAGRIDGIASGAS